MFPSRRLKHRDYSAPGFYFVTICSDFKRCIFGIVEDGKMKLSHLGRIVEEAWLALPRQFSRIRLHGRMVMPNHVHGIIEISSVQLAQRAAPLQGAVTEGLELRRASSLSVIVRSFKADVTRRAGIELHWNEPVWQRNYFDRVIRDGQEFSNALRYIEENPLRWQRQKEQLGTDSEARTHGLAQQAAPLQRYRA